MTVFAHQQPDRVPIWCGASEEFWAKCKRELSLDDEALRLRFGDDFRTTLRANHCHNPHTSLIFKGI